MVLHRCGSDISGWEALACRVADSARFAHADPVAAGENWKRVGELLATRRGAIGYPIRERFLEAHGETAKSSKGRIITALENGERDNYTDATLGSVERMYGWQEGSIRRVARGGEPVTMESVQIENLLPAARPKPGAAARRWDLVEMIGRVTDGDLDRVRTYLSEVLSEEE